ncbi:MAG: M1 family metallopeptidase [Bacteroidota bacterium]
MNKVLFNILASLLFNSCAIFNNQYFGITPRNPGSYPHFTSMDYMNGQLDEYRAGYDVTFYNLNLHLDPDKHFLRGEVAIHFRAVEKLKNIRIDLYRNFAISSLKISGKDASFVRNERSVTVSLPDSLLIGRNYTIEIAYEGEPVTAKNPPWSGGIVWGKDRNGNTWIGISCETEGGSIWFPCKDHLSDEPDSVRLSITVPSGIEVVSNGILENHTSKPGTGTYTWSTHYPINIYNITFYAGKFEHFKDTLATDQGIVDLDYYVMPENLKKAKEHFSQVKDIIRFFSASFGPYPWIKEGFKLVEGPFGGMEHQTAIAYGSGYANLRKLGADYLIVHETSHEWWGNAVSVSDFCDIWLQEGFATYSEMIFTEYKKGYDNSLLYASNRIACMINNKLPVAGPPDVSYWNNKDNDVYNKGAMILHTIRNIVNDSTLFFDILQTFYHEHAISSHVTSSDFIELVERKTGNDWDKFFDVYLYSRQVPVLYWYFVPYDNYRKPGSPLVNNVPFVAAKWMNVPEGFTMPVSMYCKEGEISATIDVSTKPTLFYLNNMTSCRHLTCNKNLSYFNARKDISVLKEADSGMCE